MSGSRTSTYAGVGTAYVLSGQEELADDERFTIHGVALGAGDITVGQSGTKKYWPADALREAAETLAGQPLVRNHTNNTKGKVGEVTHAAFIENVGVVYEAEIAPHYDELIDDMKAGLMEVSIRAYHPKEDQLEEDDETGALIVDELVFDNLSVVIDGASPSNTAEPGSIDNILDNPSTVAASATVGGEYATATLERSAAVDKETVTDLAIDDTDNGSSRDIASLAPEGIYTADDTWFAVAPDEHSDDSTEHADNAKYPLTSCTGDQSIDSAWQLRGQGDMSIEQSTLEQRIIRAAKAMDCDPSVVGMESWEETSRHWMPEEGQMVEWRANQEMWGKVVHVDEENHQVMVEVMTPDGESTGHTVTAGYSDLQERAMEADDDGEMESEADDEEMAPDEQLEEHGADITPDHDDIFENEDDAVQRSMELGLDGDVHPMEIDGTTYYMPGDSHEDYKDAVSETSGHGMDDEDDEEYSSAPVDGDTAELVEMMVTEPEYEKTTTGEEFSAPTPADFDFDSWDEMGEVAREILSEHYLLAESESMPPDDFEDLEGAVVTADGALSQTALESVRDNLDDLVDDDETRSEAREWIESTRTAEFEEEETSAQDTTYMTVAFDTAQSAPQTASLSATTTHMIDYEPADADELDDELDDPVVVERDEFESLSEQAEKAEDVEETLEQLSEKVDEQNEAVEVVEQLSDEDLEMIQSEDDATVVEAGKVELVDEVSSIYAEELAEYSPFEAEELAEKFDPLDLKSRVEDHDEASLGAQIAETEPEPEAGDVDDDELSDEGDDSAEKDEEELREKYAQKLEKQGWATQANKVRNGELPVTQE